jgi:hypothetical protein
MIKIMRLEMFELRCPKICDKISQAQEFGEIAGFITIEDIG